MCVVSTAAAHQVAAVGMVHQRLIAHPSLSAHAARHGVCLAVAGRFLDVHQIRVHGLAIRERLFDLEESRAFVARGFDRLHVDGVAVFVFEDVAQLAKLGEGHPAGSGGAGSRHTVTFTLQTHVPLQDLRQAQQQEHEKSALSSIKYLASDNELTTYEAQNQS